MKKKNFKLKAKFLLFVGLAAVVAFLCGSIFVSGNLNSSYESNRTAAAINYADVSDVVRELGNSPRPTESSYNLSYKYPILTENQTSSNFCWTFASSKVLETSLMVQANEYHNFSDVGMALLAYNNGIKNIFNAEGNFNNFCEVMQTLGVVYENDFSNDKYFDIINDVTNTDKYSYINDYADKSLANSVLPICFADDKNYIDLDDNNRQLLIKNYIKKYGGVFAGLEAGTYSKTDMAYGRYSQGNTAGSGSLESVYKSQSHAVCIIGWDNQYGWLAINSWGVETSYYEKFYIPFNYRYTYRTFSGFICQSDSEEIKTSSTSADTGISTDYQTFNTLDNVFIYGNKIEMEFAFDESIDFSSVYFAIFHGKQEANKQFEVNFDDKTRSMSLNLPVSNQQAGTYLVKLYSDSKLIGTKEIFVYTGTEISYIKLSAYKNSTNDEISEDTEALMSMHSSSETDATFYIYTKIFNSFNLNLYRNDISATNISLSLGNVYLTYMEGGEVKSELVSSKYDAVITNFGRIRFNFSRGADPTNKMVEFVVNINSTTGMPTRSLNIKIIVSGATSTVMTKDALAIEYVLDGGTNSSKNIQRFPNYGNETNMTSFKLYPATKEGSDFAGWYIDPEFKIEFPSDVIDENLAARPLVLYAKWSSTQVEYFDGRLEAKEVVDYDKKPTELSKLVYGDSVAIAYNFEEKPALKNENYIVNYIFYINENKTDLNNAGELKIEFPNLEFGNYEIKVVVNVIISRQFSVTKTDEFDFSVEKKQTGISFNELSHVFDGEPHFPSDPVFDGVYAEDKDDMLYTFNKGGEIEVSPNEYYEFEVTNISNKNYELVGNKKFDYKILPRELVVNWSGLKQTYNGLPRIPDIELKQKDDGKSPIFSVNASVLVLSNDEWINQGVIDATTYSVKISALSSLNYVVTNNEEQTFVVEPAKLTIKINDVSERLQTAVIYRKGLTYEIVSGSVYAKDDLGIKLSSKGLTSDVSGNYEILVSHSNKNYDIEIQNGTYTLLGTYSVFYKLPNGEYYEEIVQDGEVPKGITSDIYKLPPLSSFSYNQPLEYTGYDLHITVTIINYTWVIVVLAIIIIFIVVYAVITHKIRKNKVR